MLQMGQLLWQPVALASPAPVVPELINVPRWFFMHRETAVRVMPFLDRCVSYDGHHKSRHSQVQTAYGTAVVLYA